MNKSMRVVATGVMGLMGVAGLASVAQADVNVALNRPVSLVSGSPSGVAISSLTDGAFLPRGGNWSVGTVWWLLPENPVFQIDLGGVFSLTSAIVQADDNDTFMMEYRDLLTGNYLPLVVVGNYDAAGSGMQTRPNPADDTAPYFFPGGPVMTDTIRIYCTATDGGASLSEVQVFAVPTPGATALLGLGGLAAMRRKRAK